MTAKEQLLQELEQAQEELIEETLDFLLFVKARRERAGEQLSSNGISKAAPVPETSERSDRPIWELFEEFAEDIPEDELAQLPTDGAEQHDHYIYGTPKRST
jgi:hypothetical protein